MQSPESRWCYIPARHAASDSTTRDGQLGSDILTRTRAYGRKCRQKTVHFRPIAKLNGSRIPTAAHWFRGASRAHLTWRWFIVRGVPVVEPECKCENIAWHWHPGAFDIDDVAIESDSVCTTMHTDAMRVMVSFVLPRFVMRNANCSIFYLQYCKLTIIISCTCPKIYLISFIRFHYNKLRKLMTMITL